MSLRFEYFTLNGTPVSGNPISFVLDADLDVQAVYQSVQMVATWPTSPQLGGAALTVSFSFNNYGADGNFVFTLKDGSGNTLGSTTVPAAANTINNHGAINFTMPNGDAVLTISNPQGGNATATIQRLIPVATTLTLNLPTTARIGEPIAFSGSLTRADSGLVGVQTIKLIAGSTTLATVSTSSNGAYSGSFTIPSGGTYVVHASFEGSGYLASSLSIFMGLVRFR